MPFQGLRWVILAPPNLSCPWPSFQGERQSGYEFFTLDKFQALESIDHDRFELYEQNSISILTSGDEAARDAALATVEKILRRFNLMPAGDCKLKRIGEGSPINLRIHFSIPRENLRMYAKLAFNHLAFITSAEFVRGPAFNYIRRFIRYGEESAERPLGTLRLREPDISAKGAAIAMRRHILATGVTNLGSDISGLVVIFDTLLVKFKLCRFFPELRYPAAVQGGTAHFFDVQARRVACSNLPVEFDWLA